MKDNEQNSRKMIYAAAIGIGGAIIASSANAADKPAGFRLNFLDKNGLTYQPSFTRTLSAGEKVVIDLREIESTPVTALPVSAPKHKSLNTSLDLTAIAYGGLGQESVSRNTRDSHGRPILDQVTETRLWGGYEAEAKIGIEKVVVRMGADGEHSGRNKNVTQQGIDRQDIVLGYRIPLKALGITPFVMADRIYRTNAKDDGMLDVMMKSEGTRTGFGANFQLGDFSLEGGVLNGHANRTGNGRLFDLDISLPKTKVNSQKVYAVLGGSYSDIPFALSFDNESEKGLTRTDLTRIGLAGYTPAWKTAIGNLRAGLRFGYEEQRNHGAAENNDGYSFAAAAKWSWGTK